MGPHSDLDILVVMPDGTHRREASRTIFRALRGLGMPKDIVVVTEQDVRRYGDNHSLVVKPALKEGDAFEFFTGGDQDHANRVHPIDAFIASIKIYWLCDI